MRLRNKTPEKILEFSQDETSTKAVEEEDSDISGGSPSNIDRSNEKDVPPGQDRPNNKKDSEE